MLEKPQAHGVNPMTSPAGDNRSEQRDFSQRSRCVSSAFEKLSTSFSNIPREVLSPALRDQQEEGKQIAPHFGCTDRIWVIVR